MKDCRLVIKQSPQNTKSVVADETPEQEDYSAGRLYSLKGDQDLEPDTPISSESFMSLPNKSSIRPFNSESVYTVKCGISPRESHPLEGNMNKLPWNHVKIGLAKPR